MQTFCRRQKCLVPARYWTLDHPAPTLVTIPTEVKNKKDFCMKHKEWYGYLKISRRGLNVEDIDWEISVKYIECLLKVWSAYTSCGWLYNCSTFPAPGAQYGGRPNHTRAACDFFHAHAFFEIGMVLAIMNCCVRKVKVKIAAHFSNLELLDRNCDL